MRKFSLFGLAALASVALACSGTGSGGATRGPGVSDPTSSGPVSTSSAQAPADDGKRAIVFEVTGKGISKSSTITYGVGGNSSQANGAKLPWKKQATSTDSFLMLSLVAQSGSGGNGTISCRITVDGQVLIENSSQGGYAVVTCSETA